MEQLFRPNPCPGCGGPVRVRKNRTHYCTTCYALRYGLMVPCPRCDRSMSPSASQCRQCTDKDAGEVRKMTRAEAAWLAGIVEGEGTLITLPKPELRVAMTDADIVERLVRLTGVGRTYSYDYKRHEHYKPVTVWSLIRQRHLLSVIKTIRPWLGERRGLNADLMIQWLETRRKT